MIYWLLLALVGILLAVGLGLRKKTVREPEKQDVQQRISQAAVDERARIYRDIHDDIGSKLLTLLHTSASPQQADLIRTIMQDLRDVVSRGQDASGSLLEVLAQIREETEQRLAAVGAELAWELDQSLPDPQLDEAQALHLFRITREAVTNALRHSPAHRLRIRARHVSSNLILDYTDDGPATGPDESKGAGAKNMQERAQALHGTLHWTAGTQGGTKVVLEFPIPKDGC